VSHVTIRAATAADAPALFTLISDHLSEGHLLPRTLDDLERHAPRFIVCEADGNIKACAELAPLSANVAEVRSLVVSADFRRVGLAARLVSELQRRARAAGFHTLCAFTHDPRFFVRQNFSIVPHLWLPEKISTDCVGCPLFRKCQQYAMVLSLDAVTRYGVARPAARRVAVA
jgi:amino-acid N-acetyltransferase